MAPSSDHSKHGVFWLCWNRYLKQLDRKPLQTKALTAAGMSGASNILAQLIVSKGPIKWKNALAMALFGFVWSGPSSHYWFAFLEDTFGRKKDAPTIACKVIADQLVYGPICNILAISFISMAVEGGSLEATSHKLRRDYAGIQLNGWKLWPLASIVNQSGAIPVKLRALFVNCVAFVWCDFIKTLGDWKSFTCPILDEFQWSNRKCAMTRTPCRIIEKI